MVLFDVTSSARLSDSIEAAFRGWLYAWGYAPGDTYPRLDAVLRLGLGDPTTVGEDQR